MDLLDRYLEVVRFFLPAKAQDDIIRELKENSNMSFQIGFMVTAVIVVIQVVKQLQRLKRATPMPPDPMTARAAR